MTLDINQHHHCVSTGTVVLINSHSSLQISDCSSDSNVYCVFVNIAVFKPNMRERISRYPVFFNFMNYCSKNKVNRCAHLLFKIDNPSTQLLFELYNSLNAYPDENCVCEYFLSLIANLSAQIDHYDIFQDTPFNCEDRTNGNILDILNYIYNNYQHISLIDLADHFHYSPNYLSNLIRQNTNMTFGQHLTQKRLKVARYLLETTNYSVNYIIKHIGYSDKSSFYRQFLREYNHTPSQIRKIFKQNKLNDNQVL